LIILKGEAAFFYNIAIAFSPEKNWFSTYSPLPIMVKNILKNQHTK